MVRNLYLLRHGHAENGYQMNDFDRELTAKGTAGVNAVGAQLKEAGVKLDLILCSTAVRTVQTSELIVAHLEYDKPVEYLDEIYEASIKQLFDVLATANTNQENVMLIGHNPAISFLNEYLADETIPSLAPGEISKIVFAGQDWNEITKGSGSHREI
ncbi:MAG: phosphohistidine phosphatase SixA [Cyclobacteriaceae bacterium]